MHPIVRLIAVVFVFCVTSVGWLVLGGVTHDRSNEQTWNLSGKVSELWGSQQTQAAPGLTFSWVTSRDVTRKEVIDGVLTEITERVETQHDQAVALNSTDIDVDLNLDQRRKGLVWYPLYDVGFDGAWTYRHEQEAPGTLTIRFAFPTEDGIYDNFHLIIDGEDRARSLIPEQGVVSTFIPVEPGQEVTLQAGYRSRGATEWRYVPANGVANLEAFRLSMATDFADIDFPAQTMSPSKKTETDEGWALDWHFAQVVTGHDVGMVMPQRIQPGELAATLSFSAPISLMFFFLVLFVLGVIRGIDIHPINYLFLGGAFFAFHLLFAYSVDHLPVEWAFALCSLVSVTLVVSYLRLVVSSRFAFVEAGLAQLVYLVGFSLAHFSDGFTGLTVTVLSIITLFVLMQLTGRVKWSEVLSRQGAMAPSASPAPAT